MPAPLRNLLRDTLEYLADCNKSVEDIHWVGSSDGEYTMLWEDFRKVADRLYDPSTKVAEVVSDLVIVGLDWWMERTRSESGWECWDFKTKPMCNVPSTPIKDIFAPSELELELLLSDLHFTGDGISDFDPFADSRL